MCRPAAAELCLSVQATPLQCIGACASCGLPSIHAPTRICVKPCQQPKTAEQAPPAACMPPQTKSTLCSPQLPDVARRQRRRTCSAAAAAAAGNTTGKRMAGSLAGRGYEEFFVQTVQVAPNRFRPVNHVGEMVRPVPAALLAPPRCVAAAACAGSCCSSHSVQCVQCTVPLPLLWSHRLPAGACTQVCIAANAPAGVRAPTERAARQADQCKPRPAGRAPRGRWRGHLGRRVPKPGPLAHMYLYAMRPHW